MYLLLLPGVAYYVVFNYLPMYGVVLAFKDFSFRNGIMGSAWVGLRHFQRLLGLREFWQVTRNTLIINFY